MIGNGDDRALRNHHENLELKDNVECKLITISNTTGIIRNVASQVTSTMHPKPNHWCHTPDYPYPLEFLHIFLSWSPIFFFFIYNSYITVQNKVTISDFIIPCYDHQSAQGTAVRLYWLSSSKSHLMITITNQSQNMAPIPGRSPYSSPPITSSPWTQHESKLTIYPQLQVNRWLDAQQLSYMSLKELPPDCQPHSVSLNTVDPRLPEDFCI